MKFLKNISAALFIFIFAAVFASASTFTEEENPDYARGISDAIVNVIDGLVHWEHRDESPAFAAPEKRIQLDKGQTKISVRTNVRGAEVFLNNEPKGQAPVQISGLMPGNYELRVEKPGFLPVKMRVRVEDGTGYLFNIHMTNILGRVEFSGTETGTQIFVDNEKITSKVIELPEGVHKLKVRQFGYSDLEASFSVHRHMYKKISLEMTKCDFELTEFSASKNIVNPKYKSSMGRITFTAEVTAPGSGKLEITDASGRTVFSRNITSFVTWENSVQWNGRTVDGTRLPDGTYTVTFTAEDQSLYTTVQIDSTMFYHLADMTYGGSGIGTLPQAFCMPEKTILFDMTLTPAWKNSSGFYDMPFTFGLNAWLTDNFELSGKFAAFFKLENSPEDSETPVLGNISLKYTGNTALSAEVKFCYGAAIHYGYTDAENLESPLGNDCGAGLDFTGIAGFETAEVYTGFTTDFILGATSSNPSKGDNTWRNGIAVSYAPVPEVALNASLAVNSNSRIFDSIEPQAGFSALIPGMPLYVKFSGQAKIYFDQAVYFSGTAGLTYLF